MFLEWRRIAGPAIFKAARRLGLRVSDSCEDVDEFTIEMARNRGTDFAGYAEDTLARYKDDANRGATSKKKRKRIMWETTAAGLFDQVVADEGHMLKTTSTRVHQSVARLQARPF
ncbi:hypothetical protein AnigIFM62618_009979 [Aspergillus niger]|nr:hypothetical protein AnigIFM62618_009979 [Aspergillus niger]